MHKTLNYGPKTPPCRTPFKKFLRVFVKFKFNANKYVTNNPLF